MGWMVATILPYMGDVSTSGVAVVVWGMIVAVASGVGVGSVDVMGSSVMGLPAINLKKNKTT